MTLPIKQEQKYNYQDYLNWNDDERWEIINGIAFNMSPAPSRKHQDISRNILVLFANHLEGKSCRVYDAPFDVRFAEKKQKDDNIYNVVQPDIVVVCDENKLDDKGCIGSPDLVVEIVSPSSAIHDAKEKFFLYEKYGVKEYWIVYPDEKMVMVFKLNEKDEYGKPAVFSSEEIVKTDILPGFECELQKIFKN